MEYMMQDVVRASKFSRLVHDGQLDKAGVAYWRHPAAVAHRMQTNLEKIVAYLHDVVEDTDTEVEDIASMFGEEVAGIVEVLTHKTGEPYMDYVARVARNVTATRVKLADLNDNMDLTRFARPTAKDVNRVKEKYYPAYMYLLERGGLVYEDSGDIER